MIKVLIIEDDPMVAEINMNYINKIKDFNIVGWSKNGEEAFKFIKEEEVDLLILDVYMPKVDGIELLKKLRKEYKYVDVIFVTAAKESHIIDQGLKLGAVDYLIKPFTFDRMKLALEKYKDRVKLLSLTNEVSQEELDKIFDPNPQNLETIYPKGIHKNTLNLIVDYIEKLNYEIDLELISKKLNISSVTARHFLEYLVDNRFIFKEFRYGDIGRPKNYYHK